MSTLTNRIGYEFEVPGDVVNGGTLVLGYPAGTKAGSFARSPGNHVLMVSGATYSTANGKIAVTFGASSITVTWNGGRTLKAGEKAVIGLELNRNLDNFFKAPDRPPGVSGAFVGLYRIASPVAADSDAVAAGVTRTSAGDLPLNGALVSGGKAEFDYARVVSISSAGNLSGVTFKVHGTDIHGRRQTAQLAGPNANTVFTTKAFKTVDRVSVSAAMGGVNADVGFGNTFGLPFFLGSTAQVILTLIDGASSSGSYAAGVQGAQTATNGDSCGTVSFGSAPDGVRTYECFIVCHDLDEKGVPPYAE